MSYVLGVLLALAVGGFIAAGVSKGRKNKRGYDRYDATPVTMAGMTVGIIASILFTIFAITWASEAAASAGDIQRMESFARYTRTAYSYTVTRTEEVVIDTQHTRTGALTDLAYQQQGLAVSQRLRELRDEVEWYNARLTYMRAANKWPIIGTMIANVPDDLRPIILGGS